MSRGPRAACDDLHLWLQDQTPVDRPPEHETDLPFPFNLRTGVIAWNLLFLEDRDRVATEDPVVERGACLVEHPGHCGECHTPRDDCFGMQGGLYLAGEVIDGWLAPNLTPDPLSGIGSWAAQDLIDYLRTGDAANIVQAAGPMARFVQHGTSHLHEDDLAAIVAYLRTLRAIDTRIQDIPLLPPVAERIEARHSHGQIREEMAVALARIDLTEAESLYPDHCAACHGVTGHRASPRPIIRRWPGMPRYAGRTRATCCRSCCMACRPASFMVCPRCRALPTS
ncbi:MAG: c-type cytochrome [Rubellimicrobium sp.]|nr:c-type cytochrome [Rubellimicrobium sp.]